MTVDDGRGGSLEQPSNRSKRADSNTFRMEQDLRPHLLTQNGPADPQPTSLSCFLCSGTHSCQIHQDVHHLGVLQCLDGQCNPHHTLISSVLVPRGGWVGYANPPVCPALLSQLHTSSLEVVGLEVRHPASTGRAERGEDLWGPPCAHDSLRMGHMGCAGLQLAISSADLHSPPMDSTLCASPSVVCLRLSFCSFKDVFLLTHTKKSVGVLN